MSTVIHILERDEDTEVVETHTIDICDISALHCTYPIVKKEEEEEQPGFPAARTMEAEFMLNNGERVMISITSPTVFRIFYEDGSTRETTSLQKFEESYLEALVVGFEESGE